MLSHSSMRKSNRKRKRLLNEKFDHLKTAKLGKQYCCLTGPLKNTRFLTDIFSLGLLRKQQRMVLQLKKSLYGLQAHLEGEKERAWKENEGRKRKWGKAVSGGRDRKAPGSGVPSRLRKKEILIKWNQLCNWEWGIIFTPEPVFLPYEPHNLKQTPNDFEGIFDCFFKEIGAGAMLTIMMDATG